MLVSAYTKVINRRKWLYIKISTDLSTLSTICWWKMGVVITLGVDKEIPLYQRPYILSTMLTTCG